MNTRPLTTHEESIPRILVVDDMPDNLFLMNGLLEDLYDVVQASSGREALEVVMSANPPDLVLLDIMMPDMDGYEVLRRIRQHAPTANIPVVFLTALASKQDQRLGLELGAVDYLTKPVSPERVIQRLESHMRATRDARRMEELSERLARHLTPAAWDRLFQGRDRRSIRFEERTLTMVYAETTALPGYGERGRDAFCAEIDWLVNRYGALTDDFVFGAAVAFLEDPHTAVRMAMDLQRTATALRLRVGVHTGSVVLARFESDGMQALTLLGGETRQAARVASSAASGSIMISPQTYAVVQDQLHTNTAGCLLMEEFLDSDLAQACLTPAPVATSTFAGLGLT
jgi:CheY-like chemotaxis protein